MSIVREPSICPNLVDRLQAKTWIDEWEEAGKLPRRAGFVTVNVDLGNFVFL
jgi:hypothetical protein